MNSNYFSDRHTIRKYLDREIPTELLNSIIDRAVHAPTTGNMQLYSVIATRDAGHRKSLAALHFNQPAAVSAPLLLTICIDLGRFSRWCELSGAQPGFGNFQGMMYGMLDASIVAQQITTIAETEGLGTCYLGTTTFNAPQISELLKLPKMVVPLITIAVGYPDEKPEITERIMSEGVLYDEEYPDFSDNDILQLYKVKDDFPANTGYAAEHSKPNIASVFTDVRYPKAMNEEFSGPFVDFLRKKGFDF